MFYQPASYPACGRQQISLEKHMMTSDMMDRKFAGTGDASQPDLLVSAVLHLMSHYSAADRETGCTKLASVIERHLKTLAELPDLAPVLQVTCSQLSEQWASVVKHSMPRPERSGFLVRLTGAR
jgi:hypothetical protein